MAKNETETPDAPIDFGAVDFSEFEVVDLPDKAAPTTGPPAENVLAMAQASWDARKRRSISFRGNLAMARAFETEIKKAGPYTTPPTSMSVSRPDDGIVVFYRAGERRGRKNGSKTGDGKAE
jgi:hypothetical protein